MSSSENSDLIVLFDGVCTLCNASVDFVMRRDAKRLFRYASLQSKAAAELVPGHDPTAVPDSLVLIERGVIYRRSTAALRIARRLGAAWPLVYALIVVPPALRDAVYDWIGRNRYRWFGKNETCRSPTAEERTLFL